MENPFRYLPTMLVFLLLLALSTSSGQTSRVPGVLEYSDGKAITFSDLVSLNVYFDGYKREPRHFPVFYENSWRQVPYSQIRSIEILAYMVGSRWASSTGKAVGDISHVTVSVITATGVNAKYELANINSITIRTLDELTGEQKDVEYKPLIVENPVNRLIRVSFR